MKRLFLVLILFSSFLASGQKLDTLSISELISKIQLEPDSVFKLENAFISIDPETESSYLNSSPFDQKTVSARADSLKIECAIFLRNVTFDRKIALNTVRFNRDVDLRNVSGLQFYHCLFLGQFQLYNSDGFGEDGGSSKTRVINSQFRNYVTGFMRDPNPNHSFDFQLINNKIDLTWIDGNDAGVYLGSEHRNSSIVLEDNILNMGSFRYHHEVNIEDQNPKSFSLIINNQFLSGNVAYLVHKGAAITVRNNIFPNYIFWNSLDTDRLHQISWPELSNKIISLQSPMALFLETDYADTMIFENAFSKEWVDGLFNVHRVQMEAVFQREMDIRGRFIDLYRSQRNTKWANKVFIELKDLETARLAFLYSQNPSFDRFFEWKVNQFLRVFSNYGTKPSKAIVISLYVILSFALIYLFFPNHWDSHGKTRIMDRYRFFLKYLNRDEGASEVYHEEKQKELMPLHEFKEVLEREGKTAPKFFYATALPLYKWSVSGSRLSGWFLSKIDVLNGKWSEVPEKGRFLKSALVIGAFIIALIYDIFIKVLNAVMLSINTFTTLGFGEIPIKGLPRYLAIIQGFIGWFMLTIFSVSLISQLLN